MLVLNIVLNENTHEAQIGKDAGRERERIRGNRQCNVCPLEAISDRDDVALSRVFVVIRFDDDMMCDGVTRFGSAASNL